MSNYIGNEPTIINQVGDVRVTTVIGPAYNMIITDIGTLLAVDASAGSVTINLLEILTLPDGATLYIKKVDNTGSTVTIDGFGSEEIDGSLTQVLTAQNEAIGITSANTSWLIFNKV